MTMSVRGLAEWEEGANTVFAQQVRECACVLETDEGLNPSSLLSFLFFAAPCAETTHWNIA